MAMISSAVCEQRSGGQLSGPGLIVIHLADDPVTVKRPGGHRPVLGDRIMGLEGRNLLDLYVYATKTTHVGKIRRKLPQTAVQGVCAD